MASLYLLLPVALLFVALAVALFLWAVRNHQFDDLEKEGQRILFERDESAPDAAEKSNKSTAAEAASSAGDSDDPA
ncbi:MAG: cbb3-type cytochrome oxidase assembly protein CcoS [Gammaproteobacteria bacterium]|nr:cbb3-type cytochrome oxidase assembly protein CcoS [Gammaproteobacteria bacterium]NND38474.1 cbb3-type cytochrome oxidase assembly protein CcoS [Pseudomonadales bacterium]MBT8150405.1 cbb3-type cytochrome oxidase assembly protein CcoS [Gammaproteobacteria bacterium]NNL11674.1 cbb3-type cytochrome oxidase assembly protein CcoS [Pseudomonadales bacterium]NNM11568.1 cbb3-type cytochrome oxidase assembly protein CcoS [Pseudomonadales bacterium]